MSPRRALPRALALLAGLAAAGAGPAPGARAAGAAELDDARLALRRGEIDQALAIAEAVVAADPEDGRALLLLGETLFAAERFDEALASFDRSRQVARPPDPGTVDFNRAAALFGLERFAEAEEAYQAATVTPRLAPLAWLNASWAAAEQGAWARARSHAAQARALPGADAISPELDELDEDILAAELEPIRDRAHQSVAAGDYAAAAVAYEEAALAAGRANAPPDLSGALAYAAGVSFYRADQADKARRWLDAAVSAAPDDGEYHFMAARAAFALGDDAAATRSFRTALTTGVDDETRQAIATYLDALTGEPARSPWSITAELTAGWDTNVERAGPTASGLASGGGAVTTGILELGWARALTRRAALRAGYGLEQVYYPDPAFEEFNLQEHRLQLGLDLRPRPWLRLRPSVEGAVVLNVPDFGVRLWEPRFALSAAVRFGRSTTRMEVEHARTQASDDRFAFLSGSRTDVRASEELRFGPVTLAVRVGWYDASLGTERVVFDGVGLCPSACTSTYVIPRAYRAPYASLSAVVARGRWRLAADVGGETRRYQEDSFLVVTEIVTGTQSEQNRLRREDLRLYGGARASRAMGRRFEAGVRFDWLRSESNVDDDYTTVPDYDDMDYSRLAVTADLSAEW